MRKFLSAMCASALTAAVAVTGVMPASAAPMYMPTAPQTQSAQPSDVIQVDSHRKWRKNNMRRGGNWDGPRRHGQRRWRDNDRRHGWNNDRRHGWHNGYRGYRYKRPGYRYYDGLWFPGGAFVAGAIIGGAIANSNNYPRYSGGGSSHVQWCYDRYRSYRASDNTFQPYNGGRRQCYSPYS
jgi:hypothetical protein